MAAIGAASKLPTDRRGYCDSRWFGPCSDWLRSSAPLRATIAAWDGTCSGYAIGVAALVAVYLLPTVNGAHRWIRFGGIGLQPSEFVKVIYILSLSRLLMHRNVTAGFATPCMWPMAMATLPMLMVLKEPDLGTSLIFLPVMFAMLFTAGVRRRDLVRLSVAGMLLLPLLWSQMSHEQRSRVTAMWEQNGPHEAATADGFHLDQGKASNCARRSMGHFLERRSGRQFGWDPLARAANRFSVLCCGRTVRTGRLLELYWFCSRCWRRVV